MGQEEVPAGFPGLALAESRKINGFEGNQPVSPASRQPDGLSLF